MSEMRKKVARAICASMGYEPDGFDIELLPSNESEDGWKNWMAFQGEARAALLALREPTKDMMPKGLEAIQMNMDYGRDTDGSYEIPDHGTAYHCFVAMIDAILSETQEIAE